MNGGQGGIRTPGTLARSPVFKTGAINRSATCPTPALYRLGAFPSSKGSTVERLKPTLIPLGDRALLVRFGDTLSDAANRTAVASARRLERAGLPDVVEVVPGLVSVLLNCAVGVDLRRLAGEVGLALEGPTEMVPEPVQHRIPARLDGEDVAEVAAALGMEVAAFRARHNAAPLRVLATGFAPGFVYCGFHPADMVVPRRTQVRAMVPAGTILFAAAQTAIAATPIRTGWHVIGRTAFQNFDASATSPTRLAAGDDIVFEDMA